MKELKKHLSLEQQIELLLSRGLIIKDVQKAERLLSNINYYRLSGYLYGFKEKETGKYKIGTTLEQIKALYDFDRKLTRVLMFVLEDIEETLKTRISYVLTSAFPDNPVVYLEPSIYRSAEQYNKFKSYFYQEVASNAGLPFIKHHNEVYGGQLPMWVAVEIFTMGNLSALYKNLKPTFQKKLARGYNTGVVQLESWIQNLTFTRNHLAHYMRIYSYNFGRTPIQCKKHHLYNVTSGKIFDQIYIMSFLYSDAIEWDRYVIPELSKVINEYEGVIELSALGFPENWQEILINP